MMRLKACVLVFFCALILTSCGEQGGPKRSQSPKANVVILSANGLGISHISAYGGRIATPNIDALASQGVRFDNAYAASPLTGPSKAAILTGRHPTRYGFEYNARIDAGGVKDEHGLNTDEITIADQLKKSGFTTAALGVWALGSGLGFRPQDQGFDYFYGTYASHTPPMRPSADGLVFTPTDDYSIAPARNRRNGIVTGNPPSIVFNDDQLLTTDLAEQAARFIQEGTGDQPFFLMLNFNAPHTPLITTEDYYNKFSHIRDHKARVYAAMIAALDDAVGRVKEALEESGQLENTLLIFTSSSSCDAASGQCSCAPIKGSSGGLFEGGLKVPLIMHWPEGLPKGKAYNQMVSLLDIMPSALAAAHADEQIGIYIDGINLLPHLRGERQDRPHKTLYWRITPMIAVLDDGWKLILDDRGQYPPRLYDLNMDPLETKNLSKIRLEKVFELKSRIDPWRLETIKASWVPEKYEEVLMCEERTLIPR